MTRILVLGSAPHCRNVDSFAWDALPSSLTVADYDVVILNLKSLDNNALFTQHNRALLPTAFDFGKLIFSQGSTLIFLGSPANIEFESKSESGTTSISRIDPKSWLPCAPVFEYDSGEAMHIKDTTYNWFFKNVREWNFHAGDHFMDCAMPQKWFDRIGFPRANCIANILLPIAETRFQRAIAFVLRYRLSRVESMHGGFKKGMQRKEQIADSGSVIWLPSPTVISEYDAINLILTEKLGIVVKKEAPAWVGAYTLPRQIEAKSKMDSFRQQAQDISASLKAAESDIENEGRYNRLLYEQGDPLEDIVWSVLEELGAKVEPPKEKGKHDGRFVDPKGRSGVLEIKGRTKTIGLADVRQCEQWTQDAIEETKEEFKGLLIGNAQCGVPLDKRDDWFASNAVELAERYGIGLVKTSSLFRAIHELQDGTFDQEAFWDAVISADGDCEL